MRLPSDQPDFRPAKTPRFYRALAAVAGPLEKILGITCRDFTWLASAKLDRPLTLMERSRYFLHRIVCSLCRKQERRMQQLNRLAGDVIVRTEKDNASQLPEDARARIRERLARELKRD
jgi:hypothetical protein